MHAAEHLASVPYRNEAAQVAAASDGGAMVEVPLERPGWLVPPISWLLPYSSHRRVRLDSLGVEVLGMCDGENTVETIIEKFAALHKLSFREAQLPVTQFFQQMTQRGIVVLVGAGKGREEHEAD